MFYSEVDADSLEIYLDDGVLADLHAMNNATWFNFLFENKELELEFEVEKVGDGPIIMDSEFVNFPEMD